MKKKKLSKKLSLSKKTISGFNMNNVKGGATYFLCASDNLTCQSMCDFSCYVGTCQG